jgi:hypothetical protein
MTGHAYEAAKCDTPPQCCSEANLLVSNDYSSKRPFLRGTNILIGWHCRSRMR